MALEKIQKANDIKELTEEELKELSDEIRRFLIEKISVTEDIWHPISELLSLRWHCIKYFISQRIN